MTTVLLQTLLLRRPKKPEVKEWSAVGVIGMCFPIVCCMSFHLFCVILQCIYFYLLLFICQAKTSTGTPSDACMVFYPRSWKQLWETPSDQMWHLLRRGISRFARMHMHRMSSLSCMCNALIDILITCLYMRYIHMYVSAGVLSTLGDIFIFMLQPIY